MGFSLLVCLPWLVPAEYLGRILHRFPNKGENLLTNSWLIIEYWSPLTTVNEQRSIDPVL